MRMHVIKNLDKNDIQFETKHASIYENVKKRGLTRIIRFKLFVIKEKFESKLKCNFINSQLTIRSKLSI